MAISRRPLAAEARVRFRVRTCRICGRQCGTGTGFSPGFLVDKVTLGQVFLRDFGGQSYTGTGFSPGFVVDRVALGQVFLRVIRFSPVNIISP
jgi:hypothetical protein